MPAGERPSKRVLVRWSDDLDKQVLLCIQYACQEEGVRIPMEKVATLMGPKFSAGAIVQHLAKLRAKMQEVGLEVPPPLKKGVTTKEASKIYTAPANKKRKASDGDDFARAIQNANASAMAGDGDADGNSTTPARRGKGRGKKIKKENLSDDEDEEEPELYDSDGDYGTPPPKKKAKRSTKKKNTRKTSNGSVFPGTIKAEPNDEDVKDEDGSPASNTRHIRTNYAELESGFGGGVEDETDDNYEDDGNDVPPSPPSEGHNGIPTPDEDDQKTLVQAPTTPKAKSRAKTPKMEDGDLRLGDDMMGGYINGHSGFNPTAISSFPHLNSYYNANIHNQTFGAYNSNPTPAYPHVGFQMAGFNPNFNYDYNDYGNITALPLRRGTIAGYPARENRDINGSGTGGGTGKGNDLAGLNTTKLNASLNPYVFGGGMARNNSQSTVSSSTSDEDFFGSLDRGLLVEDVGDDTVGGGGGAKSKTKSASKLTAKAKAMAKAKSMAKVNVGVGVFDSPGQGNQDFSASIDGNGNGNGSNISPANSINDINGIDEISRINTVNINDISNFNDNIDGISNLDNADPNANDFGLHPLGTGIDDFGIMEMDSRMQSLTAHTPVSMQDHDVLGYGMFGEGGDGGEW